MIDNEAFYLPVIRYTAFKCFSVIVLDAKESLQQRKRTLVEQNTIPETLYFRVHYGKTTKKGLSIAAQNACEVVGWIAQTRATEIDDAVDYLALSIK